MGQGGEEWLVCEPRTSPAGWLAHEAGPGTADHVGPSQPQPWEWLVEPNSLHPQESHSQVALPALGSLRAQTRRRSRVEHFSPGSSSQLCLTVLESQAKLTGVQTQSTVLIHSQAGMGDRERLLPSHMCPLLHIRSFNNCPCSTHWMPDTIVGAGEIVGEQSRQKSCPWSLPSGSQGLGEDKWKTGYILWCVFKQWFLNHRC